MDKSELNGNTGKERLRHVFKMIIAFFAELDTLRKGIAAGLAGLAGIGVIVPNIGIGNDIVVEESISQKLVGIGFHVLQPVNTIYGPGVFATVKNVGKDKVAFRLTCNMDMEMLREKWRDSPTIVRATNDSKYLTMSGESLRELHVEYFNGSCQKAVLDDLQHGAKVCQVQSVIGEQANENEIMKVARRLGIVTKPVDDQWLFIGVQFADRCVTLFGGEDKSNPPDPSVVEEA